MASENYHEQKSSCVFYRTEEVGWGKEGKRKTADKVGPRTIKLVTESRNNQTLYSLSLAPHDTLLCDAIMQLLM